ncbi:phage tail tape measure protein [Adhaeribacter pallidiroseus]|uniref:Uncharacterized protein n=1 Tax=Adhaeribacter pallidiroseus TaxID=2072847 RepID=A0A369QJ61_9BACT|nr:hypothetical protein [Adhaeribacter pallidiroseus]RDC63266.1 hypothetical protein AHMF7616_01868 [Adhaeribacter pallidiroseus]
MAQVRTDKVQVELDVKTEQATVELDNLTRKQKLITDELKNMKRGTDEFVKANQELTQVNKQVDTLRTSLGTTALTLNQLEKQSRELNRELKGLTPGTASFIDKSKQLTQVEARAKEVKAAMRGIGDEQQKATGLWSKVKEGALGVLTGTALYDGIKQVGTEILNFGKESVAAFNEAQQSAGHLKNAVVTLGGESEGSLQRLLDQSDKLEMMTFGFSAENIQAAQAQLKTFGLTAAEIERLTPKLLDYATANKKDLAGATDDVTAALLGKDKALQKSGITLDQSKLTVEGITNAFDKFKGSSEAALNDGANGFERVSDVIGVMQENIGEGLLPVLEEGAALIGDMLEESEPLEEVFVSLGETIETLWDSFSSLFATLFPFFEGANRGSVIMKTLAFAFNLSLTPLKALAGFIQLAVDEFNILVFAGKKAANFFGADFKIDPKENFSSLVDKMEANAIKNFSNIKDGFTNIFEDQKEALAASETVVVESGKRKFAAETKANDEASKAAEKLRKEREKAAEELRKKQEQLAKEELERQNYIRDLEIANIADETARKIAALQEQARREISLATGTAQQKATIKELLEKKLVTDIAQVQKEADAKKLKEVEEQAKKEQEVRARIANGRAELDVNIAKSSGNLGAMEAAEKARLDVQTQLELQNTTLTEEEKLLIHDQYEQKKSEITASYAEQRSKSELEKNVFAMEQIQAGTAALFEFKKIANDREMSKLDKDKQVRLQKLQQEYNAGKISKESYENGKNAIETNYDAKARNLKKKAAQDEKTANIANSIMAGLLGVIKAAPNVPLQIATGILATLTTAKIAATPLPSFSLGGLFKGAGHRIFSAGADTWRGTRKFANGGTINPTAGIAGSGQLHSNGGIQMVDGATGEHLGEWEKGEAYMILSRNTVANNGSLINKLLDSSLHRGGSKVHMANGGMYSDGSVSSPSGPNTDAFGVLVAEMRGIREEIKTQKRC